MAFKMRIYWKPSTLSLCCFFFTCFESSLQVLWKEPPCIKTILIADFFRNDSLPDCCFVQNPITGFLEKKKNYHFLFEISFLLLIKKVNPFYLYCWHDLFWVWFWICHLLAWLCLGLHVGTCITSLIIYFLVIPAPSFSVILLFVAKKHQKNVLFTAYFVF